MRTLAVVALAAILLPGAAAPRQAGSPYQDEEARRLLEGALRLREQSRREGPSQALVRNRMRVGLLIPNQWNWRDRTLFRKEVLGVTRYGATGGEEPDLLARSRGAPVIGDALIDRPALWDYFGFDPEALRPALFGLIGLSLAGIGRDFPSGDSPGLHQVFDSLFVDPLGPRGPEVYRYALGEPLRMDTDEGSTLQSVVFRPADPEVGSMTGILWFESGSGRPVRAMIRPHGRWALNAGLRGLIRRLPLLPKDALGGIDYLVVDYSTGGSGVGWPVVARVQGAMYWFGDQAILPVQIEWELDWDADPPSASGAQPPPPLFGAWSFSVDRRALDPFLRDLDRVVGPPPAPGIGQTLRRGLGSVRFNQVQGINFEVHYPIPVGARTLLSPELGLPTSSFTLTGQVGLHQEVYPYRWGGEVYARLRDANWMEAVNGFTSSITALLTGFDDGSYYLAKGGSLGFSYGDRPLDGSVSVFAERHRDAPRRATYSLFEPRTPETPAPDLEVRRGAYYGARARLDLQLGDDAQKGVLVTRIYGQAVTGESSFASIGTTTDLVGPLPGPLAGGLRLQMGLAGGDVPPQALYYLGGLKTIRGYPANVASGASTCILTGEVGTPLPLARLVVFADAGWVNEMGRLFDDEALTAVGVGLSLADGTLRADVARGLGTGGVWRLHVATSGLF